LPVFLVEYCRLYVKRAVRAHDTKSGCSISHDVGSFPLGRDREMLTR